MALWSQADPLGLVAGPSLYVYAGGNPVGYTNPTGECPWCIGAAIGFSFDLAMQLSTNGFNLRCIDKTQLLASTALGALGGGLGGRGLTSYLRSLSNSTKRDIGETLSVIENRLRGSRLVDTQSRIAGRQNLTTVVDSTWDSFFGRRYYVESKFGTSGLTGPQRGRLEMLTGSNGGTMDFLNGWEPILAA
ncbi:hypothetical protein S58_08920 [Bradyrhizobium oligotrophicum S58]|uniref:RHS repeat-associated core domain-containing protein n=1 Tax=Bradyrhizobium oligotrophicum S58 TaxID=1245469 RepID=M4Z1A3_9BRAD|nr:hypothetical protein S58_08920 [Bradyrhizobium oligotrophicum S58]